jgi:glycosyltransferase involved in cell wall biosynthesis
MMEAVACEKAVIVSDIPELRYVTDQEAGTSFTTGNASSLSAAMEDLARNACRREMGRRGRQGVKDYTLDKVALRYEEFLEEVLRKERFDAHTRKSWTDSK